MCIKDGHPRHALAPEAHDSMTHSILTHIPLEIIETILSVASLVDVSAFAQTCRTYRKLVYDPIDSHLWRTLFLHQREFDDPRMVLGADAIVKWDSLLQRFTAVGKALRAHSPTFTTVILQVLIEMTDYARPARKPMALDSDSLHHLQTLLRTSGFFNSDTRPDESELMQKQLLSRLKVYAGLEAVIPTANRRLRARSFVYDLRNYNPSNSFGPFFPDGSGCVNWPHVQAIQEVIAMNILDFVSIGQTGDLPMTLKHIQPQSIPRGNAEDKDWAGLGGRWQVVFCFCDHRDLLAFNRLDVHSAGPDPSIFDDDFEEALRFLEFELSLVGVEEESSSPPSEVRGRPTLNFVGTVSGNARVKGKVLMTPDNQVRWTFVSGEPGQTIWSTEGVQIGGVASAYGVLGSWTTVFHDIDDPVGPMWLWKLPD